MRNKLVMALKRSTALVLALGLVASVSVGCGKKQSGKNDEDVFKEESAVSELEEAEVEEEEAEEVTAKSLLTNEPLDEDRVNKRPVSIMIENTKMALPQYGLNEAGIVYECPAEGGITRFLALFDNYNDMDRIGNIRSCRPYYAYIAAEYDSIYMHYGQSVHGKEVLETGIVDDLNGLDGSIERDVYFRSSDKKAPHNAYTSTDGINKGIEDKGYRVEYKDGETGHFLFAEKENKLKGYDDAQVIKLYFPTNNPYYVYDSEEKLYTRYQFGAVESDAVDSNPVKTANIILQNVTSSIYPGTQYLDITLTGSGEGKYLTRGKVMDITWSKASNQDVTHYYDEDGNEIKLNTGKTWVHLIENAGVSKCQTYATKEEAGVN